MFFLWKQRLLNGPVYLADTGSALGLLIVLYKYVDPERQSRYADAVQRHLTSLEKDGMIHSNGAIGVGWGDVRDGKLIQPIRDEYTTSSALTGGEIYTWMYHMTKEEKYRRTAYQALHWVLSTMRKDGVIPYILIWYYEQVDRDPRVVTAVRKFDQFLMNPQEGKTFGLLTRGPLSTTECNNQDAVTSLAGYALSDILVPGISSRW